MALDSHHLSSSKPLHELFTGIRHDSGDIPQFIEKARKFYESVGRLADRDVSSTVGRYSPPMLMFSNDISPESCSIAQSLATSAGFRCVFAISAIFAGKAGEVLKK